MSQWRRRSHCPLLPTVAIRIILKTWLRHVIFSKGNKPQTCAETRKQWAHCRLHSGIAIPPSCIPPAKPDPSAAVSNSRPSRRKPVGHPPQARTANAKPPCLRRVKLASGTRRTIVRKRRDASPEGEGNKKTNNPHGESWKGDSDRLSLPARAISVRGPPTKTGPP